MPAPITHYLFAERVLCLLKKRGICISVPDMYFIGTQGPDIFFFHRVFPWERGKSHASVGRLLHRTSPALLFEGFCNVLDCQTDNYNAMLCYVLGFFCHYALDRTTHPFIYCSQSRLSADDPGYGTHPHQYHFRIESALDTIMLRRQTGRMIKNFNLLNVLPHAESSKYALIGYMYHKILLILYGLDIPPELLAYAPADMRHALFFMDDRTLLRRKLVLRPMEKLLRQGHMVTSLLRPNNTSEWDYANTSHKM